MAGIRALLGLFPKTGDYESHLNSLDQEYKDLVEFSNSSELRDFNELEVRVRSDEFAKKRKEILSLRFKKTEDYQKEKQYKKLARDKEISLFKKVEGSDELKSFQDIEKSDELKKLQQLEEFVNSAEYAEVKKETSLSAKKKFEKSDLAKTLNQYETQRRSSRITSYKKFVKNKAYGDFVSVVEKGLDKEVEKLQQENKKDELKAIKKSKEYKNFRKLSRSAYYSNYKELHNSDELEAFVELEKYVSSDEFKRNRKEIETRSFKDTDEYQKLQEYENLKKSSDMVFYTKFKNSKGLKNYLALKDSEKIRQFEELENLINGDEFKKFKAYCLKSPRKRWEESSEYEVLQDYKLKKKSEKIAWYFANAEHKKFDWHRKWSLTFNDEFSGPKLDTKSWLTKYYWGDKMLKDSYSLSQDKHYVTDGGNLNFENGRLHIVTRKESASGKSWNPSHGFVTRDFAYTSGLINTANSFRQQYGIFRAKVRITTEKELHNAFWMVGKTMVPHIDIIKAAKKLNFGNSWGDSRNIKSIKQNNFSKGRRKFTNDFFIYSLEWKSGKLSWAINGLEVASTSSGVPEEEMYIAFSAGLQTETNGILPAQMEIDWVRCHQQNDRLEEK